MAAQRKKRQNTPAAFAAILGMLLIWFACEAVYRWNYAAAIKSDPVTVQATVLDIGGEGNGMAYEYEYGGKRYEGKDPGRLAFGLWVGAKTDVVINGKNPTMSTRDPDFLRRWGNEFGWIALGLLVLVAILIPLAIRRRAHIVATPQVQEPERPSRESLSGLSAILMLAIVVAATTAGSIGITALTSERAWITQLSGTANRPDVSAEQKLEAISRSIRKRRDAQRNMMPVMVGIFFGSIGVFALTAVLMKARAKPKS